MVGMATKGSSKAAEEVTELVLDFLEVAIHLILYKLQLYPPEAFERRRYFSVATQWARHPELCEVLSRNSHSW